MNVFVVSRGDAAERDHPTWQELRRLGHDVYVGEDYDVMSHPPDAIISMGVTLMDSTFDALSKWSAWAKLYCYNWDVYEWVWTRPREGEYDYKRYGELLERAHEVWVPSDCTGRRTTQWYGLTNWRRILAWVEPWEARNVRDDGYALCCLREIPDPWWGVFERCCEELNIPYKTTRHGLSQREYRDSIEGCRFICAPLYELSTGGLSLLEAYHHGKPVLLSDSEWNGGRDYFNGRAHWFDHRSEEDFKRALSFMQYKGAIVAPHHREYVAENFSAARFARDVHARITANAV